MTNALLIYKLLAKNCHFTNYLVAEAPFTPTIPGLRKERERPGHPSVISFIDAYSQQRPWLCWLSRSSSRRDDALRRSIDLLKRQKVRDANKLRVPFLLSRLRLGCDVRWPMHPPGCRLPATRL